MDNEISSIMVVVIIASFAIGSRLRGLLLHVTAPVLSVTTFIFLINVFNFTSWNAFLFSGGELCGMYIARAISSNIE